MLLQDKPYQLLFRALGYSPEAQRRAVPVSGRICIAQQSPEALAGHTLELRLEADPAICTRGVIDRDGGFHLDTPRLLEGRYLARIVLSPEGRGRTSNFGIPWKYLVFSTSGWSADLPSVEELEFVLTA